MATERKHTAAARPSLSQRCLALVSAIRENVLAALAAENARATARDLADEDRDLFERLPEPLHLDHGEVKCGDGKFRFID